MPRLLFTPEDHPELTYSDVFLVPANPVLERLLPQLSRAERQKLEELRSSVHYPSSDLTPVKRREVGVLRTYEFMLIEKYEEGAKVTSRDEVDITPIDGFGNIPIAVANMNAVTGKRMAEGMAMMGGSAAIPQDKEDPEMQEIAEFLHSRNVRHMTPITAQSGTRVHELIALLEKRDLDTAVVTETQKDGLEKFVGLIRLQGEKEEWQQGLVPSGINQDTPIRKFVRTENCITAPEGISDEDALSLMEQHRLHFLPIVTQDGIVKGVVTKKFLAMRWRYKAFADQQNGGVAMLATVGALNNNPIDRVKFLLDLGAKGIVFDTAHFDQGIETYRNVEAAASVIANSRLKILLVAGNEVTEEATRNILAAGADVAKVGIGPGAMCTTRMETAVGRPQFTAVLKCAEEAAKYGKYVWADGGIQHPRDVALALAAGASQVMIGSLFTPTLESPGPLRQDEKGYYKINHGMASRQAAILRNLGKESKNKLRDLFRHTFGHRSEGISAGKVYRRDGMRSVVDYVHWLLDGLTSSMTYAGARNLEEFQKYANVGIQNNSGFEEGKPRQTS